MLEFVKRWLGRGRPQVEKPRFAQRVAARHKVQMRAGLEDALGPMYETVGTAKVPFAIGGSVDMHYFPQEPRGMAFATMELIEPDGSGTIPNRDGTYELVAFSRHPDPRGNDAQEKQEFLTTEGRLRHIFTAVARVAQKERIDAGDFFEIPALHGPNHLVLFDRHSPLWVDGREHALLLCMEIHRSEYTFALDKGGQTLLAKLRHGACHPFTDLDRNTVA
jgi:hypothetical protein